MVRLRISSKKSKSLHVVSCGGVVYKKDRVCLISRHGGKVWALPKGHLEKGEKLAEAAHREVREETGLTVVLVRRIGMIQYRFFLKDTHHEKRVHFYLFKHTGGSTKNHDDEVDEARWHDWSAARRKLSYPGERRILEKAIRMLAS